MPHPDRTISGLALPVDTPGMGSGALVGRRAECDALARLLSDAFAGQSGSVVLRGEAGVGKTALLRYVSDRSDGWNVARAEGVESEMELAYTGLHQLCGTMLDHLDLLPGPQRDALATVFGRRAGPAPDRLLVGLAVLTLFAEVADQQPLVCIVDDAQWLDGASAQVLGIVARRLLAERIALVCASRTGVGDHVLAGLPEHSIGGLGDADARALLLANVVGPLDPAVCGQLIAESGGNPLALLESARAMNPTDLAGGFGLPASDSVPGKVEQSYARRVSELPPDTRLLLLAAAAEPLGDPALLRRAAETLNLPASAIDPALDVGLLSIGGRVEFAHPLVRSAVYRSAPATDRHRVHQALAQATYDESDPDRQAWHRARATPWPDEDVAAALERSASRARARGGLAATAAFLQKAVALTVDPAKRAERALSAAEVSVQAGGFDAALELVAKADAGPLDEFERVRVELLRAHIAFASGLARDAPPLLLRAARQLETFDLNLARETYLTAWAAAGMAGSLAEPQVTLEICRAVRALPPSPGDPRPLDLLLDGLALLTADGHAAALPTLQRAATLLTDIPVGDVLRWGHFAASASVVMWDYEGMDAICARHVRLVRDAGALTALSFHVNQLGMARQWLGDLASAEMLAAEEASVAAATGSPIAPYTLMRLRALQGREADATWAIASAIESAKTGGQGMAADYANWATAVLYTGLGRYQEAAAAAQEAVSNSVYPLPSVYALPDLVEAAARAGDAELARDALERLVVMTEPCSNDVARGIEARSRALLSNGAEADDLYREAIDRLSRTRVRPDLARAHLVYGEWLRRAGRRLDARQQLRTAHDLLRSIGMDAFAERSRRELIATGAKARKRRTETRDQLTAQEEQIARLACDGLSNAEVGAMLFLSPRTVEWHLHKVFTKLGINSRNALHAALARLESETSIS